MAGLTLKQQKFCDEYIISGNATQAATLAGYSKKTARSIGQENLTKPDIKKYIDERLEELESSKIAKQDEVLRYLTSIMRGFETEQAEMIGIFSELPLRALSGPVKGNPLLQGGQNTNHIKERSNSNV